MDLILDCEDERFRILEEPISEAFISDMPLVLELIFVSEEEIRTLNARERGVDRVTDVLSFPAAELTPGEPICSAEHRECVEQVEEGARMYLGSVLICTKRAEEQAAEYGHSVEREEFYLAVHGALHCLGYDHETEEERAVMRQKEEEIMARIGLGR